MKLGRKKLGVFAVDTALPDIFPGETILKVPLPSSVWQAASTARGAKLCIKLQGTCPRLGELLLDGRDKEPEDAWEVALLNKSTQWSVVQHSCFAGWQQRAVKQVVGVIVTGLGAWY